MGSTACPCGGIRCGHGSCCGSPGASSAPRRAGGSGPRWWIISGPIGGIGGCSRTRATCKAFAKAVTTGKQPRRRGDGPRNNRRLQALALGWAQARGPGEAGGLARPPQGGEKVSNFTSPTAGIPLRGIFSPPGQTRAWRQATGLGWGSGLGGGAIGLGGATVFWLWQKKICRVQGRFRPWRGCKAKSPKGSQRPL